MSNLVVRTAVEGQIVAALPSGVPFISTINEGERPAANTWVTVEYQMDYEEKLCYSGDKRIENGSITVSVVGRPGIGPTPAHTVAENLVASLRTYIGGPVEIIEIIGPNDAGGDADGSYVVELVMNYTYAI